MPKRTDIKKILLIGGEGYIGNVISEKLLLDGYAVTSFDNLLYKNNLSPLNHIHHPGYKFVFGDMTDGLKIEKLIVGFDVVILLAGLVGDPITKKYPIQSRKINDLGVKKVVDLCAVNNIKKLIYISTCSNYGFINNNELAKPYYKLCNQMYKCNVSDNKLSLVIILLYKFINYN